MRRIVISPTARLLALLIALTGGAGAILAREASVSPSRPGRQPAQAMVGGLGTGPAVNFARCGRALDGRVSPFCSWRHGAVAGGDRYCPLHGPAVRQR